ncbi:hypothetical protein QF037_000160 [Streptomyces canus]|nr:hypothetical protein [Streptomyces canus]
MSSAFPPHQTGLPDPVCSRVRVLCRVRRSEEQPGPRRPRFLTRQRRCHRPGRAVRILRPWGEVAVMAQRESRCHLGCDPLHGLLDVFSRDGQPQGASGEPCLGDGVVCPGSDGVGLLDNCRSSSLRKPSCPQLSARGPPHILDLVASGKKVVEVARLLGTVTRRSMSGAANASSIRGSCPVRTAATCPSSLRLASASPSWRSSWPSTAVLLGEVTSPKGGSKPSA